MMFCTPDSGSFSKADILRGIITEKLSIATRDILAVVERTVADYEEEASGFRRRIARQERQLELLQPRVHLRTCCEEPEPEPLKEELLSPPPGVEDSGRSDLPQENHEDDDDDDVGGFDDEVNDEEDEVQPSAASRRRSKDPDFKIPSRSMPHKPPQYTARLSRVQNSPTHLDLKIRFMMDPNVTVFRPFYLKNTLVRDFSFPRDLPESEFVDLLRSSFPPLAGSHKAFDIYTVNRSKKLQKLPLRTMTPNEIIRSIKANAPQAAVLFIKLKNPEAEKKPEETSADKLKGTSEENLEENVKDNVEENTEGENTEEERLEEDPEDVSAVEDKPSSCDAEEDEAGPSSSSSPLGFRKKAEFRDSPEHHEDSEMDDVDQDDVSAEDPEWKLESQQQEVMKKAADKSLGERRIKRDCKVCGFWYRSLGSLIKHAWTHMNEPQRVCSICGDAFESIEELQEHLRTYDEVYKCEECGKNFVGIHRFKKHVAMHSRNEDFQCEVCGKKFVSKTGLNLHRWSHAEERPHKCDLCEKTFGLKSLLLSHRRSHENKCHVCNKILSTTRNLSLHLMSHSEKRHFACEVCGKRFKHSNTLNSHKKVHMDRERSFLCHICCKTFFSNGTLKIHMRTHSSEKPFVCQDCGKGFLIKGNLKIHQRVHTGERPYVCSHCGQGFKRQSALNSHVRIHLGIKPFACSVCGKASSTPEHLRVHMRTHTGERPYKCSLCDKAFTQGHCLKTHMMKHHAGENQNRMDPKEPSSEQTKQTSELDAGLKQKLQTSRATTLPVPLPGN